MGQLAPTGIADIEILRAAAFIAAGVFSDIELQFKGPVVDIAHELESGAARIKVGGVFAV